MIYGRPYLLQILILFLLHVYGIFIILDIIVYRIEQNGSTHELHTCILQEGADIEELTQEDWKPFIAVVGDSPYEATYSLVIEKQIMLVSDTFYMAIAKHFAMLYMCLMFLNSMILQS